ncbi:MAG: hypothetical protein R3B57_12835 [Phycisphaerales bacterium]
MRAPAVMLRLGLAAAIGGVALLADARAPEPDDNLLKNSSFEDGDAPWWSFHDRSPDTWGAFTLTDQQAHAGNRSARLAVDPGEATGAARVWGVVQEVKADRCPEYLSGWYRVEGWQRGTKKQYLQAVVIVWNPKVMPEGVHAGNYQVACTLAGVDESPLPHVVNRKFIVTGPVEPVQGEWVFFELDLSKAFEEQWGIRPEGFEYLRVFFEARYDDRAAGEQPRATVYYDDLYLGDHSRADEAATTHEASTPDD